MRGVKFRGGYVGLLCAGFATAPGFAIAEQSGAAADTDNVLQTIIVTANRRETGLQDVPFSIVAFGADQIKEQRLERADDLFQSIPGAVFATNVKTASFAGIRGLLTLEDAPATDLPIAFFVDDVYISGISDLNLNYFDLDRIEVLRGPQGTLFGRNVIGGAISFVTKRPQFDQHLGARLSVGNDRRLDAEGYLNGVLVPDRLAGRVSFSSRNSDGYVYNRVRDQRLEDDGTRSLRGQLLYTPSDGVDMLLAADYTHDQGDGSFLNLLNFDPTLVPELHPDPWIVDQDFDTGYERTLYGGSARIDVDVAAGTLTSITAYRRNESSSGRDVDASPLPIIHSNEFVNNRQFTQEVRFASTESADFSYVVGAFYLDAQNFRVEKQRWQGLPGSVLAAVLGGPGVRANDQSQDAGIESYAVFGEATYRFNEEFSLALGGRYTRDEKSGYSRVTGPLNPILKSIAEELYVPFSKSWTAFTPRAVLRYEPTADLNFYATVARGFKGGGFTAGLPTRAGLATPFDPEHATNYELGAKTQVFDRRLQINAALFRQETKDLQVRTFNPLGVSIVGNAASARVQGLEIETTTAMGDHLTFNVNYAYLDAEYREFQLGANDYSGNRLPYAPKHSLGFGTRLELPLSAGAVLAFAGDYTYRSELELLEANNLPQAVRSQTRLNVLDASVELTLPDPRWRISLWGKNLTSDEVLVGASELTSFWATAAELGSGARGFYGLFGRPRSYGATLSYEF
jgi:iron complex outermembrane recepter protein